MLRWSKNSSPVSATNADNRSSVFSRCVLVPQLPLGVQLLDQRVEHHAVLVDERLNVLLDVEHASKNGVPLLSKLLSRPRLG